MAKFQEIDVEIDAKTGQIKMETMSGFMGDECTKVLDELQKAMDAKTVDVVDKPEKLAKEKIVAKPRQTLKKN